MSRNPMSKLSAGLLVLVMALATLVVLPGPNQGQAPGTNDIYVPVVSGGVPVSGATVTLTNVHTGEVIQATPSGGLYRAVDAPSGYYRVDVIAGAYYDAVDVRGFKFLGTTSYTVSPQIQLTKFPTAAYSWNVTVVTATLPHTAIQGARVSFYNDSAREKVAVDTGPTGIQGYTTVVMFPTASPDMYLTVEADGYETNATAQTVSTSMPITVWLDQAGVISGLVTNSDGSKPATSGVVAYALDSDTAQPWIKRLLKSEGLSPYFVFNAKIGDTYTVCVDAPGLSANVSQVVATGSVQYLTKELANQTQRTEQVDMTLATGYGSFSYSLATVLSYDDAIPGMNYSDIGSLRMQIDLGGFGLADSDLSLTEIGKFGYKLTGYGVAHPTSGRLLTINNTLYSSDVPILGSLTGLSIGSVVSEDGVSYSYTSTYTVVGTVDSEAPEYMMNATAMLDSAAVHHVNNITLPSLYEAVQNSTGGHVDVTGYHPTVMLSSKQGTSVTELVNVWIEESQKPTVKGGIDTAKPGVYAVKVDGNVTKYIVKVGVNVTFDASDSVDPNGNPLTYTWDFADTTARVTTKNKTVVHKFADASVLRLVVLNISDVSNLTSETTLNVTCDGLAPTPVITFLNKTVNATDNSITVNQRESFVLNATDSTDDVAVAGDGLEKKGKEAYIDYVEFDYGDGNKSGRIPWSLDQQNVSHAYANAGNFNLTLNVTDVVGQWKNTTIVVHVNDTTTPTISYTVKNRTGGTNLVENNTIVFDASLTTDNLSNVSLMHFSWYFGDGKWLNGTGILNVTHNYTRIGSLTVSLNVTDLNGNHLQTAKQIQIASGPRPNMRIDRVYYEPGNFTEGKSGYIIVNLTNTGSAAANKVVLSLYLVNSDGTQKLLTTWDTLWNDTIEVTVVEVGGKVQAKIPWTFDNKGTYTFKLNVTSENQLSPNKYTASGDLALHVKEAGWKKYLLWGGVAAVIILVPLGIYMSRRLSKREKKGPRREKKVEKEKDEDL